MFLLVARLWDTVGLKAFFHTQITPHPFIRHQVLTLT